MSDSESNTNQNDTGSQPAEELEDRELEDLTAADLREQREAEQRIEESAGESTEKTNTSPTFVDQYPDVTKVEFDGGKIVYLVGTAHISKQSVDTVEAVIREVQPDTVLVELDDKRLAALEDEDRFKNLDIVQILKSKQTYFVIAQLALASIQKKLSENTGIQPGAELKAAVVVGRSHNAEIELIDREIGQTLKRAWASLSLWDKTKIAGGLLLAEEQDVDEHLLAEMREKDAVSVMMEEFSEQAPGIKEVLIDERDQYMAQKIHESSGQVSIAVVGAGHVPGLIHWLHQDANIDLEELETIPPKGLLTASLPWILVLGILGLWTAGFVRGDWESLKTAAWWWVLANGALSAIGALAALAHPLSVIAAFAAAPITSLNPTIGAGMVVGLVQAWIVRPRVVDLQHLSDDFTSVRGIYRNRVGRVLLAFFLSSLGSAIGTFVALPALMELLR